MSYEDDKTPRLIESLGLVDEMMNTSWCIGSPIIVIYNILNDMFERLQQVGFSLEFPNEEIQFLQNGSKDKLTEEGIKIIHSKVLKIAENRVAQTLFYAVDIIDTEQVNQMMKHVTSSLQRGMLNPEMAKIDKHVYSFLKKNNTLFIKQDMLAAAAPLCNVTIYCATEKRKE